MDRLDRGDARFDELDEHVKEIRNDIGEIKTSLASLAELDGTYKDVKRFLFVANKITIVLRWILAALGIIAGLLTSIKLTIWEKMT